MGMMPWVQKYWDTLSEEDRSFIKKQADVVTKHVNQPNLIRSAVTAVGEVLKKFPWFEADLQEAYGVIAHTSFNIVYYSEMDFLNQYFQQFLSAQTKSRKIVVTTTVVEPIKEVKVFPVRVGSKLLVHNETYGDIVVTVVAITNSSYIILYKKDGKVLIRNWRVPKTSDRILKYIID